ncbi:hypothetical protein QBC47DRAFT_405212 [Echria macrotheca]|uniref:Uncharacterized protein n=1 Tax=Echria macrotheca TaxID=438768 RepID=A0AAJ0F656_9PEZI|nr:hypothetical protein QBC47DRAFT_405212 [Echria macrotheca]
MGWAAFFSHAQCSNDHDRVYALAGLRRVPGSPRPLTHPHGETQKLLALGYASNVEDVYLAFAVYTLKTSQGWAGVEQVTSYAGLFPSKDVPGSNLPSWVPDWRATGRTSLDWANDATKALIRAPSNPPWNLVGGKSLRLHGRHYSTITAVADRFYYPPKSSPVPVSIFLRRVRHLWRFATRSSSDRDAAELAHPASRRWAAFLDCLSMGPSEAAVCSRVFSVVFPKRGVDVNGLEETLYSRFLDESENVSESLPGWESPEMSDIPLDETTATILHSLETYMDRLLCLDDRNHVVNCGEDTQVGDVLVIFPEMRIITPYILRPTNGSLGDDTPGEYKLIGLAYYPLLPDQKKPDSDHGSSPHSAYETFDIV